MGLYIQKIIRKPKKHIPLLMKKISQIAKECGVEYYVVSEIIRKEGFVCEKLGFKTLTKEQEDLIHQILYFEGKITEITLESRINSPEPPVYQEPFEDFKKRTYGRHNS